MHICPRCSHQNQNNTSHCELCGAELNPLAPMLQEAPDELVSELESVSIDLEDSQAFDVDVLSEVDLLDISNNAPASERPSLQLPGVGARNAPDAGRDQTSHQDAGPSGLARLLQAALETGDSPSFDAPRELVPKEAQGEPGANASAPIAGDLSHALMKALNQHSDTNVPASDGGFSREGTLPPTNATDGSDHNELVCPTCGYHNAPTNRFCGACGTPLEAPAASEQEPESLNISQLGFRLISINEDGSDGVEIPLQFAKTVIGRAGDTRFPTDAFLSPKHAALLIDNGLLFIEDLISLNGTFIKIRDEVELSAGDIFLMGRQVLRFEQSEQDASPKARASDGTRYMGSPPPGGHFKIQQVGIGGIIQNVYCISEIGVVLGREKGEIIFPRDKFMSGRHAQIYQREDERYCLIDLNSSNGTWIKIWEKTQLFHDDFIFLGQQLFRVETQN